MLNLIQVSKRREDGKHVYFKNVEGIVVHKVCRRENIKDRNIKHFLKEKKAKDQTGKYTTSAVA